MRIYLVRHGDAEATWEYRDSERHLTALGERQAERVGEFFKANAIQPTVVVTSGYARAEETATAILARCGGGATATRLTFPTFSPGGASDEMKAVVDGLPEEATVLAVGHLPSIVYLARALSEAFPEDKSFGNCTLAAYEGKSGACNFLFHRYNEELV